MTPYAFPSLRLPSGSSLTDPVGLGAEIADRCRRNALVLARGAGRTLPRVLRAHSCKLAVYVDASGFLAVVTHSSKAAGLVQASVFRPNDGDLAGHYHGTKREVARALGRDGYVKIRRTVGR